MGSKANPFVFPYVGGVGDREYIHFNLWSFNFARGSAGGSGEGSCKFSASLCCCLEFDGVDALLHHRVLLFGLLALRLFDARAENR